MPSLALCADVPFPRDIAYQSAGGPGFNTTAIVGGGGQTVRLARWSEDLGKWDLVYGILEVAKVRFVRDFHTARRGKFQSFLFYDHEDHESVGALLGTGNGVLTEFQLVKEYFDGPDEWSPTTPYEIGNKVRPLTYAGQIFVCVGAGTSGSSEPTWVTAIGGVTVDNASVIWSTLQGPDVYVKTLEKPIPGTVVVYIDDVAQVEFTDYTVNYSTGKITPIPLLASGVVTADCEFYRKVNFDIDQAELQQQLHNGGIIQHLPIVEERPAA